MDEIKLDDLSPPQQSLTLPTWSGIPAIPLAIQLNEQCIEMLCELANTPSLPAPPFVAENRELWRHLHTEARIRAAAFPFVIVNVRFDDDSWWPRAGEKCSRSSVSGIPPKLSESLILETLLFARQVAREDQNVAKVTFGMSGPVAAYIATLTLPQARAIALGNTQELQVRWADNPQFWREVLIAARDGDEETLTALRHHAKKLFCSEAVRQDTR